MTSTQCTAEVKVYPIWERNELYHICERRGKEKQRKCYAQYFKSSRAPLVAFQWPSSSKGNCFIEHRTWQEFRYLCFGCTLLVNDFKLSDGVCPRRQHSLEDSFAHPVVFLDNLPVVLTAIGCHGRWMQAQRVFMQRIATDLHWYNKPTRYLKGLPLLTTWPLIENKIECEEPCYVRIERL